MITVLGATGRIGRQVTRRLLAAGEQVRAVGRDPLRLAELAAAGAESLAGDASDPAFVTRAFRDADAVHTLLPYDPTSRDHLAEQTRLGQAIVTAARDAGVPHLVAISSVGADRPAGTGFVASLHAQEQRLRTLTGTQVLVLRPGNFVENFVSAIGVVQEHGVNVDAVPPDSPIPMVATCDVADAAATALATRDWTGFLVRELLGPRDLSYAEATGILGAAMGRPGLGYVQLPDPEMVAVLVAAGFAADAARLYVELGRALGDGTIASVEGRSAANTTPTRFEDVVVELVRAATVSS